MAKYTAHRKYYLIALFTCVGLAVLLRLSLTHVTQRSTSGSGRVINVTQAQPQPQLGKPFRLIDQNNQRRTQQEFHGKIVLIYFGYSFCPDICPTALYNITDALTQLGPKAQYIQTLFITVDPQRDSPPHLKEFMSNFHPSILALSGSQSEIDQVIHDYKVYAQRITPDNSAIDYLIDHTSIIYIFDRRGNYINSFAHQTSPQHIIEILTPYL